MISTLTPKPCQDVRIGDRVVGHDGRLHAVTQVHTRPFDGELVVLKTFGAAPVKFTPNHPLLVYRRFRAEGRPWPAGLDLHVYSGGRVAYLVPRYETWQTGQPVWIPACEIEEGDYLLSPKLKPFGGTAQLPPWRPAAPNTIHRPRPLSSPDDDIAWLFGLYIADGNAVPGHKVVITLSAGEKASIDRACRTWQRLGLSPTVQHYGRYARVVVYSSVAADSFREWFGTESASKHIPDFLYHGWNLRAVLDGVCDGDGCSHRNGFVISTTSKTLALQLHQLLLTLGERPSMSDQPRSGGEYPNAAPGWTVAWYATGNREFMRHWEDWYLMPVREVSRESYSGMVWNYEVEEAHSYLANNVVAHNCMAIVGVRGGGRPGAFLLNSWGGSAHRGPVGLGNPSPAGFWADAAVVDRMLKQGDSWAFSGFAGFPARKLDWYALRNRTDRNLAADEPRGSSPWFARSTTGMNPVAR
jgi:hypothetical protein